ncbi:hypothetical protein H1230_26095 [Paenibacillus sp. 19GGS1-52]|uniref:PKD domain-containing protein n=1 Tax=Paenibacillus sp. 19GGS1-52 TaxID=2758563 RepID=UPI001EFA5893|nr:PKD domain-containing protein [Paenibacillus sp. 19GGS1-52]ULO06451.1 hypothetical protein H1230_26095 [Paenibacillus sp. 19GGS1-52]
MKRFIILLLVTVMLVPMYVTAAQAAVAQSGSISIPITTGLMGSNNSAKSYTFDLPSGVSTSAIKASSLKYSGSNELASSLTIENGKLKVTLKGIANQKTVEVKGYNDDFEWPFRTNIGNSIWLYSDGRRWQINEYKESTNSLYSHDVKAADFTTPSADPPKTVVAAASDQSIAGRKWFITETEPVDSQYVIASTIKLLPAGGSSYLKGEPKFQNGKIITNYIIGPKENPNNPNVISQFRDDTALATIPITGWVQGRFYSAFVNYYYTATAKLTTYSYGGKITFDYNPPTEPTLTGNVVVVKPNPNPTQSDKKSDVPVQLSLKGNLIVYTDSSNIEEWVFYAKEKGVDSTLQTKKDPTKSLTSNKMFDFTIPKAKLTGNIYRQEYTLTVTVRFKNPVVTQNGPITSLSQPLTAIVQVYTIPIPPDILPVSPIQPDVPQGKPPVAVLIAPDTVKAGEEFTMSGGGSYDPDGTIKSYLWNTPGIGDVVMGSSSTTWYPVSSIGENNIGLSVVDNDGMTGSTSGIINVIEPIPVASLQIQGTKKQNRKVTIHSNSSSPKHYPLNDALTQITIAAVSGGTSSDIKYSGTLSGVKDKDVLFKQPGTYKATISVENILGYKATQSVTFAIAPDEVPFVYFFMPGITYRNPDDGNKASISIDDMSYSPDSDIVDRHLWEYRYDSDNDGDFSDESWVIYSNENKNRLNIIVNSVGRYEVKLTVFEEFGQPTIDEFVTAADRKWADSSTQNVLEKIVDVRNRAPEIDWSW